MKLLNKQLLHKNYRTVISSICFICMFATQSFISTSLFAELTLEIESISNLRCSKKLSIEANEVYVPYIPVSIHVTDEILGEKVQINYVASYNCKGEIFSDDTLNTSSVYFEDRYHGIPPSMLEGGAHYNNFLKWKWDTLEKLKRWLVHVAFIPASYRNGRMPITRLNQLTARLQQTAKRDSENKEIQEIPKPVPYTISKKLESGRHSCEFILFLETRGRKNILRRVEIFLDRSWLDYAKVTTADRSLTDDEWDELKNLIMPYDKTIHDIEITINGNK